MYKNQCQKILKDKTALFDQARTETKAAQDRLNRAAVEGGNMQALAADVVQAEAKERAALTALEGAKQRLAAAESLAQSKEYKQAKKRIAELQSDIDKDVAALLEQLVKTAETAEDIRDKQNRLKHYARDFAPAMTEGQGAKLQSSRGTNMAFYVLSTLGGLFQDLRLTRPELIEILPKVRQ